MHEEDISMKRRRGPSVNAAVVVVCSCWPKEGDSVNAVVVVVCFCWPKEGDSVNTVVVAECSCLAKGRPWRRESECCGGCCLFMSA